MSPVRVLAMLFVGLLSLWAAPAAANIPAAFFACEGAADGDPCSLPGPEYGNCVRDTLCEDDPETAVDECLLCVDPCWSGLAPGTYCTRFDGADGVCEPQDMCTTDPEKSFDQCNRCVEGQIATVEPQDACTAVPGRSGRRGLVLLGWIGLLLVGVRQWRRAGAERLET